MVSPLNRSDRAKCIAKALSWAVRMSASLVRRGSCLRACLDRSIAAAGDRRVKSQLYGDHIGENRRIRGAEREALGSPDE